MRKHFRKPDRWTVGVIGLFVLILGIGAAVAIGAGESTGTNTACATAPDHTVGVDGTAVTTIAGTTACHTETYTIPTSTTTETVTDTATSTTSTTTPTTITTTTTAGGLPAGVTLRPIDGGPDYYCSNGFTQACGAGWDSPSFFPIADDYSFYPSHSVQAFKALGLNTSVRVTSDTNLATLGASGVRVISDGSGSNMGAETTGWHVEEPSMWSQITSGAAGGGPSRFLQPSFTWNQFVYGGISGTPCGSSMQATMSCTTGMPNGRHLDIPTADIYWFAGSASSFEQQYPCEHIYNLSQPCTTAQAAQGAHYGDMVDQMRAWVTAHPAPAAPYIETGDGLLSDSGARDITPPELNSAVWSTIIHGARMILYFGTTSDEGCGATFGFCTNVLPGQSVSDYTQAANTDAQVSALAPVINSPFALGYVTVSPAGYVFPKGNLSLSPGIDVMAKDAGGSFYVFATPRGPETQTGIHATFTTADGYTGPVTVVGENRTVAASGGAFSDTFASGNTVHIYQIP